MYAMIAEKVSEWNFTGLWYLSGMFSQFLFPCLVQSSIHSSFHSFLFLQLCNFYSSHLLTIVHSFVFQLKLSVTQNTNILFPFTSVDFTSVRHDMIEHKYTKITILIQILKGNRLFHYFLQ